MKKKKNVEHICGNCLLYDGDRKHCKVAILVEGTEYHLPVFHKDKCHMDDLGIEVQQVRWWVENDQGEPTKKDGTVKIEYPKGFFGEESK
jgi:hypothetical protein